MQTISPNRSNFAQTALVSLATFAAFLLLGLVLGYWTWAWLGPRAEVRAQAAAPASGRLDVALTLFGSAQPRSNVAAPTGIAIRLLGVVAAAAGHIGYAVVQLEGKQILAVREGEEIAPGIVLTEVGSHHVILERGGVRETLAWPRKDATTQSPTLGSTR